MDSEGIEGVIVSEPGFEKRNRKVRDHTCRYTDNDGSAYVHETRSRSYGYKPCNCARSQAEHGRPLGMHPFNYHPRDRSCCRRRVRIDECRARKTVCGKGGTCIEAEPSEPQ